MIHEFLQSADWLLVTLMCYRFVVSRFYAKLQQFANTVNSNPVISQLMFWNYFWVENNISTIKLFLLMGRNSCDELDCIFCKFIDFFCLQKLDAVEDDSFLDSKWADNSMLKRQFQGLDNIAWRPGKRF